jgi:hypothetical protein
MYNREHQVSGIWPGFGHAQARSRGREDVWIREHRRLVTPRVGTRLMRHGELNVRQIIIHMYMILIDNY